MRFASLLLCLAPLAASTLPSAADTLPTRKPGLWETTISAAGAPASPAIKQCIDEKTDKLAESTAAPGATCSKREIRKVADGYEVETACNVQGMTAEGKGTIKGDFTSVIKVDMTTTIKGVPNMPNGMTQAMVIESKRAGDCAAGQSPGDIILPNGQVMKTPGTK